MKYFTILFLILFLINRDASSQVRKTRKNNIKKNSSVQVKGKSDKRTISGKVSQTFDYCGGVEPSPEMLAELTSPQVYPDKKFYIRKDTINSEKKSIILNFISDQDGNFSFQLDPGTYMILLEEQVKKPDLPAYRSSALTAEESCIMDWWKKPYYILIVGEQNISGLDFNFYHRCFNKSDIPCVHYNGPMPP